MRFVRALIRPLGLALAAALLLSASVACERPPDPPAPPPEPVAAPASRPVKKGDKTFLALGDSYTIGEGVNESDRWPVVLASLLRDNNVSIDDPDIIARTGWTTRQLLDQVARIEFPAKYDLVTVMVGVNDQYRRGTPDAYRSDFHEILKTAANLSAKGPATVVVLSIPDWSKTAFGFNSARPNASTEIDAFNAIAHAETVAAGMTWVDVTPLSRTMASNTVEDGLHPSADQLAAWANAVLPAARDRLR